MKLHLVAGTLILIAGFLPAQAQTAAAGASTADPDDVVLVPPKEVSSNVKPHTVSGGSRGTKGDLPQIRVLSPKDVALTVQAKPTLYWYQSKASTAACEVTLVEPKKPKPLLLLTTPAPSTPGVHSFRLSKFDVELKPGVNYSWSVAVVVDPKSRSGDVVANGIIRRVEPPADLTAKLPQTPERNQPALYAHNGLFYDALQSLSDQIEKNPQDEALKKQRAKLLAQVEVTDVTFEETTAKTP